MQTHPLAPEFSRIASQLRAYGVLAVVSNCCPPLKGRFSTFYSPVRHFPLTEARFSFDLHVWSTPPAFVLSQDQTLHCQKSYVLQLCFHITCSTLFCCPFILLRINKLFLRLLSFYFELTILLSRFNRFYFWVHNQTTYISSGYISFCVLGLVNPFLILYPQCFLSTSSALLFTFRYIVDTRFQSSLFFFANIIFRLFSGVLPSLMATVGT